MNEKIMKELLPIIEKTKEGILKGVEIAQEQMPELVNQVYQWNFAISLFWCLFGFFIMVVGFVVAKWLHEQVKDTSDNGLQFGFGFGVILLGLIVTVANHAWLKILVAPKLFLIEYIGNLLR